MSHNRPLFYANSFNNSLLIIPEVLRTTYGRVVWYIQREIKDITYINDMPIHFKCDSRTWSVIRCIGLKSERENESDSDTELWETDRREREKKQGCCSKWERGNAVGGGARELTIMCWCRLGGSVRKNDNRMHSSVRAGTSGHVVLIQRLFVNAD